MFQEDIGVVGIPGTSPLLDELIACSWLNEARYVATRSRACALFPLNVRSIRAPLPLPDEVLIMIARRMTPRTLVSFAATCLHARRVARDYMTTKELVERETHRLARAEMMLECTADAVCRERLLNSRDDRWLTICGLARMYAP
jgi:hypothetical protein